jgi:phage FluMu gp28-like protein
MTTQDVLRRAWESEIAYCRDHVEYFVDNYGHIEDKDSAEVIVPFRMWKEQREALRSMHEHRLNIILKARQLGITWLALHIAAHEMLTMRGSTVVALSKTEEDGKELIRRMCVIFDAMPELVRRDEWYGAKLDSAAMTATITFPNGLTSTIKAFPAAPGAGRSFTANLVILDEWAFQQYAREIWGAAYPTINRPTGGKVIGLSTIKR